MIRVSTVQDALYGLIGWRQPVDPNYAIVDTANQATSSGRYFQDFSALVTIENIKENQNFAAISDAQFNALLVSLEKAAITKVLNQIFNSDDFLEDRILYPFENVWTSKLDNDTSFVGYEIEMPHRSDLKITLNKAILSFDGAETVKLLLFHSSQSAPVESKEISATELSDKTETLDWDLTHLDYSGGKYYIGYLRSGLTAKAIDRDWDNSNYRSCFNTVSLRPIQVAGWNSETLFDIDDIEYESETYGLNFNISAWKDYTNIILSNKAKFTEAVGLQVTLDVLDLILKTNRSNRNERKQMANVVLERDGIIDLPKDTHRIEGIVPKLRKEITRLQNNFIKISPIRRATV